jgi:hypothetical protein
MPAASVEVTGSGVGERVGDAVAVSVVVAESAGVGDADVAEVLGELDGVEGGACRGGG